MLEEMLTIACLYSHLALNTQALLAQQLQKKQLTNHIQQLQQQLVNKAQEQQATVDAVNSQVGYLW